jgi:hypothetical protein
LIKQKLRASQNLSHVADSKWEIQKVAADVMTKELCYKLVATMSLYYNLL